LERLIQSRICIETADILHKSTFQKFFINVTAKQTNFFTDESILQSKGTVKGDIFRLFFAMNRPHICPMLHNPN
jgi:hypothetical protein